jgi:hypothetical protein
MKFKPDKKQALLMWRLMFTDERPKKSQLTPKLTPKSFKELEKAGLVQTEKVGRSLLVFATDKAWEWAGENLEAPIEESKSASQALYGLLSKLKRYLDRQGISLIDIVGPELEFEETPPEEYEIVPGPVEDMDEKVREAYLELTSNRFNVKVRLADLRKKLGHMTRSQQDYLLTEMQKRKKLLLQPLHDEAEITSDDEAASLDYQGKARHVLYMWGELPGD